MFIHPLTMITRIRLLFVVVCWIVSSASFVLADSPKVPVYSNNPAVAIVDGEPIMLDALKNHRMHEAMSQLHRMQSRALKEKMLELLARKHPEFAKGNIPKVKKADIVKFYNENPGLNELGTLEQMQDEIRNHLESIYHENFIQNKYQLAIEKGWAKILLKPPNEYTLEVGVGSAMLWFDERPDIPRKVFLLEYSDFQCPFCKRVQSTLMKIRKTYSASVQFGYRHYTMPFHKEAKSMAEAVECARDQGKFWELQSKFYSDFDGTQPITLKRVTDMVMDVGVKDMDKFNSCLETGKYQKRVNDDIHEATRLGVGGTPTFIIGTYNREAGTVTGEIFSGAVPEEKFVKTIEKYLSLPQTEAKLIR